MKVCPPFSSTRNTRMFNAISTNVTTGTDRRCELSSPRGNMFRPHGAGRFARRAAIAAARVQDLSCSLLVVPNAADLVGRLGDEADFLHRCRIGAGARPHVAHL